MLYSRILFRRYCFCHDILGAGCSTLEPWRSTSIFTECCLLTCLGGSPGMNLWPPKQTQLWCQMWVQVQVLHPRVLNSGTLDKSDFISLHFSFQVCTMEGRIGWDGVSQGCNRLQVSRPQAGTLSHLMECSTLVVFRGERVHWGTCHWRQGENTRTVICIHLNQQCLCLTYR